MGKPLLTTKLKKKYMDLDSGKDLDCKAKRTPIASPSLVSFESDLYEFEQVI